MLSKKVQLNLLYFGFLFVALALLHVYHVLLISGGSQVEVVYFIIQAVGQAFLEVLAVLAIFTFLPRALVSWLLVLFVLLFVLRIVDFPFVRLLDLSIWGAFAFISKENISNFVEQLYASNISIGIWITGGLVGFALIEICIVGFYLTEKYAKKATVSVGSLCKGLCGVIALVLVFEVSGLFLVSGVSYENYAKALPWKRGLLPRDGALLILPISLERVQIPEDVEVAAVGKKPDIFLFVVESLREDYLTKETAPNLVQFRKENIALDLSLSNANATQPSWFSIFHSRFPIYWGSETPKGALPLKILKKMGYKINVYSAARLSFFRMDEIIFGEGTQLADAIYTFFGEELDPPWERDSRTITQLCTDLEKEEVAEGGRLFIVFLDATHFDYSWPDLKTRFHPFEEQINYVKLAFLKGNLDAIKNRYKNAISFVDGLFGQVLERISEDAVVVFTGDHGEEFYESGYLFHASALTLEQTRAPLYYRMNKAPKTRMTSHIDIFPSILHYLTGDDLYSNLFDGQSIFSKKRWPYLFSARYNAGRTPYEFMIHTGKSRLVARFSNEEEIFKSDALRILTVENVEEKVIAQEFGEAFDHLFPTR